MAAITVTPNWFARPSNVEPTIPVSAYCIPHAGAGAAAIAPLSAAAKGLLDLVGVRLPGRESRFIHPMQPNRALLAEELAAAILADPARRNRKVVMSGFCAGAALAVETAVALEQSGELAGVVVASRGVSAGVDRLPTRELAALGGFDSEAVANSELMDILFPIIDYDRALALEPVSNCRLRVPVLALAGRDDHVITDSDLLTWSSIASGEFSTKRVDGGHFLLSQASAQASCLALADFARRAVQFRESA